MTASCRALDLDLVLILKTPAVIVFRGSASIGLREVNQADSDVTLQPNEIYT